MSRPSDAAIAWAFWELSGRTNIGQPWTLDYFVLAVTTRAKQFDSEPEPAAPYDRCPACTAHMPVGRTCGGKDCGLRREK